MEGVVRVIWCLRSESGISMVATIFPLTIILILGLGIMTRVANESAGISQIRKASQSSSIAENGVEWGLNKLGTPVVNGGYGDDWSTVDETFTLDQALADPDSHVTVDVSGADGKKSGVARVIVQNVVGQSDQRLVTSVGQQCLNDDCTLMGPERAIQSRIRIAATQMDITPAFSYLMYSGDRTGTTTFWAREAWIQGDMYLQEGSELDIDHPTKYIGTIRSHERVLNDCEGNWGGATVYSFGRIEQKCGTTNEYYNGGYIGGVHTHDSNFPDVTADIKLDRDYYLNNSDYYLPAGADTNPTASQNYLVCAGVTGNIHYDTNFSGSCSAADPLLKDSGENPVTSGVIFLAGNIKIQGMFTGNVTFVAAGPNTGTTFGTTTITNQLYSKDTENGLPKPNCMPSDHLGFSGSTDAIGLIARQVIFGRASNCLAVQAIIRVSDGVTWAGDAVREEDEPFYFRGSMVVDEPTTGWNVRGESSQSPAWSLRFYYDTALATTNLPPGVAVSLDTGPSGGITIKRITFGEVALR